MDNEINNSIKEASKKTWGASPAGSTFGNNYEPGDKDFFDAVLKKRFSHEVPWLDEIVQFKRFQGKKVLEIGCGAGYDAFQFCNVEADYSGIDITPENPIRAQKHLSYYGFSANFYEMDVEQMNFKNEFDYIFSFGVLHHTPDIQKALINCNKALKSGGEIQVIVYNKWSIFYCITIVFYQWILTGEFAKKTLASRRSQIEFTTSFSEALVNVYSKRELMKKLKNANFRIINTDVRKLTIEDLPPIRFVWRLYKYIPQHFLDFLGRYFGWYLSVRAVKK